MTARRFRWCALAALALTAALIAGYADFAWPLYLLIAVLLACAYVLGRVGVRSGWGEVRPADVTGPSPADKPASAGTSGRRQALSSVIVDQISEAVIVTDARLVIRESNPAARAMLGASAAQLRTHPLEICLRATEADGVRRTILAAVDRRGHWSGELVLTRFGRDELPTEASIVPLCHPDGDVDSLILVCRDVSERRAAQAQLDYIANYDRLTNLPNRLLFRDRLDQALDRATWAEHRLAVLLIDVDNFELINEGLGQTQGDQLLRAIAERLSTALHRGDSLARIDGDKFGLIQAQITRVDQAAFRARHLMDLLEPPVSLASRDVTVSASIGIALYPEDGHSSDELTRNAGLALTRAKCGGRGSYRFYVLGMDEETRVRCALEHDISEALQRGEFLFHYQPQVDLTSGRVIGCEALVRWQHPEYGLLYPDQFIPMAEESGTILALGEWGLREACNQLARWDEGGHRVGRMAVNLSALQFRYPKLVELVGDTLRDTGADPRRLELEITESAALDSPELAASFMTRIQSLGVNFAIDDFGTGYSSLNYLKRLPIRSLKVDRSLISDLADDASNAAIIRSVIELGHSLRLRVLAEGIETDDQLRFLRACRCDLGQGDSFSEALPADDFIRFVDGRPMPDRPDLH